jgi:hypothetical protein
MSVSAHPADGVVVVSLWHGQTCNATFRLPVADASRLIGALADAMSMSLADPPVDRPGGALRPTARALEWVRRRFSWPPRGTAQGLRLLK